MYYSHSLMFQEILSEKQIQELATYFNSLEGYEANNITIDKLVDKVGLTIDDARNVLRVYTRAGILKYFDYVICPKCKKIITKTDYSGNIFSHSLDCHNCETSVMVSRSDTKPVYSKSCIENILITFNNWGNFGYQGGCCVEHSGDSVFSQHIDNAKDVLYILENDYEDGKDFNVMENTSLQFEVPYYTLNDSTLEGFKEKIEQSDVDIYSESTIIYSVRVEDVKNIDIETIDLPFNLHEVSLKEHIKEVLKYFQSMLQDNARIYIPTEEEEELFK